MFPVLLQHAACLISSGPPILSFTVSNSLWFSESLLSWMLTVKRKCVSMRVYLIVHSGVGGEEGGAFPLKHALLTVSQFLRIYSISTLLLFSPHSLSPHISLPFAALFLYPCFFVSHVKLRHLSHTGSHVGQACIVSPLHCFPRPIWLLHLHHSCCILHFLPARCVRNLEQTEVGVLGASWLSLAQFYLFHPCVTLLFYQ